MEDKKEPKKIAFEHWHNLDLERIFKIKRTENLSLLSDWLNVRHEVPQKRLEDMESLRKMLVRFEADWNEVELLSKFIAPLLFLIDFSGDGFNTFSERPLKAEIDGYELTGVVDWMAASGSYEPQKPYFLLHEYKRFKTGKADPLGQLLSAMLVAQVINQDNEPVYGCFVVGNNWYFVVLLNKEFGQSKGFDATDTTELEKIWSILTEAKERIIRKFDVKNNPVLI